MDIFLNELLSAAGHPALITSVLNDAIARVSAAGGGCVRIPAGTHLTGMVRMKDGVELHLERGAVLKAALSPEDHFPLIDCRCDGDHWQKQQSSFHLIAALGCRDIAITGPGRLDGNGTTFYTPVEPGTAWPLATHDDWRRMGGLVLISDCRNVLLRDVELGNVCNWSLILHESDDVRVRDLRILNPPQAPNSDGIDIVGCRGVSISGCHIDTGDDAVCLKTLPEGRSCENVTVTNCVISSHCAALKLGAGESFADMRHVSFTNCVVRGSHRAVGLYSLEGAMLEHIVISNITFDTRAPLMFPRPIHIDIRRRRENSRLGGLRNLLISGLFGETNGRCLLTCEEGGILEDITLRDLQFRYPCFDDPAPHGTEHGGSQFSNRSPQARTERAAFVIENARRVRMQGLRLIWPEQTPPREWMFDSKLANGTMRLFTPPDWTLPAGTPVHAVAVRNMMDSELDLSGVVGWNGGETRRQY